MWASSAWAASGGGLLDVGVDGAVVAVDVVDDAVALADGPVDVPVAVVVDSGVPLPDVDEVHAASSSNAATAGAVATRKLAG